MSGGLLIYMGICMLLLEHTLEPDQHSGGGAGGRKSGGWLAAGSVGRRLASLTSLAAGIAVFSVLAQWA